MDPLSVVLYQSNVDVAQSLAASLASHFHSVHVARSSGDIRTTLARYRADVLVLDLEDSRLEEVKSLIREFPRLSIICTHRLADEELWAEALRQGAADMCDPGRTQDVIRSVSGGRSHHAAA
jgi:DNA-binding NtrC family response regulator